MDLAGVPRGATACASRTSTRRCARSTTAWPAPGTFLVSATRLGGLHGYDAGGRDRAARRRGRRLHQGLQARARRRRSSRPSTSSPAARRPSSPTPSSPRRCSTPASSRSATTTACARRSRCEEQPAADGRPGMALDRTRVFVVTGAAGGITSAIVTDLAVASGGIFYLLDLVAGPARDDPQIALLAPGPRGAQARAHRRGEGARREADAGGDRQADRWRRARARRRCAPSRPWRRRAARPTTLASNLLDGAGRHGHRRGDPPAHGRIDVLLHAGGIEISRDAARQGAAAVRPRLRRQGRRLLQPAEGGRGHADRRDGRLQLGGRALRQQRPDRLQRGQRPALQDLERAAHGRPETRAIAIDWTAWGGIGMASRGSIPQIMEAAGIDMLPPEAGVPTIRRELWPAAAAASWWSPAAGRPGRGEGPDRRPGRRQGAGRARRAAAARC